MLFARLFLLLLFAISIGGQASAHPGRTASDGCHYCRKNCEKWGEQRGVRHCHSRHHDGREITSPAYLVDPGRSEKLISPSDISH